MSRTSGRSSTSIQSDSAVLGANLLNPSRPPESSWRSTPATTLYSNSDTFSSPSTDPPTYQRRPVPSSSQRQHAPPPAQSQPQIPVRSREAPASQQAHPPLPPQPQRQHEAGRRASTAARSGPRRRVTASSRDTGPCFVLAIDFGTTRTGIAFSTGPITANTEIRMLLDFGGTMNNELKVKSAISYIEAYLGEVQWGSDIAHNRVAMINMKLELDPMRTRFEELDLTLQLLRQLNFLDIDYILQDEIDSGFSAKPPETIVTDLLAKVFAPTYQAINRDYRLSATQTPVDLVMTVPVSWSDQAQNALYKAVRGAGFNKQNFPTLRDTIVVSEPEAAVHSTMRELIANNDIAIQTDDTFILCDAGGGTVDAVAFQVRGSPPNWDYHVITDATGGQFGSAIIDTEFKRWLRRKVLTADDYEQLDPANKYRDQMISPNGAETGPMRELIRRFEYEKCRFGEDLASNAGIVIDLPAPLLGVNVDRYVEEGTLTIPQHVMKKLMDKCVDQVILLVKEQVREVNRKSGRRPRELLLVGGFGGSPYLQHALRQSFAVVEEMRMLPIQIRIPTAELQTTAVVKGGVLYGLEKGRHSRKVSLIAISKSYGIVINDNFQWLVVQEDSVSSHRTRTINSTIWQPKADSSEQEFRIYSYRKRDQTDLLPLKWSEARSEVRIERNLEFDTSPQTLVRRRGPLRWQWTIQERNQLRAEMIYEDSHGEYVIGSCQCSLEIEDLYSSSRMDDDDSPDSDEASFMTSSGI